MVEQEHPGDDRSGDGSRHVGPRFHGAVPAGGYGQHHHVYQVPSTPDPEPATPKAPPPKRRTRRRRVDPAQVPDLPPPAPASPRGPLILGALIALASVIGIVIVVRSTATSAPSDDERYLQALSDVALDERFASDRDALANAERVCQELDAGGEPVGYDQDLVAVEIYCPEHLEEFRVIPTPDEQLVALETRLRAAGLASTYPTGDAAVKRATELCEALETGPQTGSEADAIAVDVYCPERAGALSTFATVVVLGSYDLSSPPQALEDPLIVADGDRCEGASLWGSIVEGASVQVRDVDGELLAEATLNQGSGSSAACSLTFAVELEEGADVYVFTVGDLPPLERVWEDLSDGRVSLSPEG